MAAIHGRRSCRAAPRHAHGQQTGTKKNAASDSNISPQSADRRSHCSVAPDPPEPLLGLREQRSFPTKNHVPVLPVLHVPTELPRRTEASLDELRRSQRPPWRWRNAETAKCWLLPADSCPYFIPDTGRGRGTKTAPEHEEPRAPATRRGGSGFCRPESYNRRTMSGGVTKRSPKNRTKGTEAMRYRAALASLLVCLAVVAVFDVLADGPALLGPTQPGEEEQYAIY